MQVHEYHFDLFPKVKYGGDSQTGAFCLIGSSFFWKELISSKYENGLLSLIEIKVGVVKVPPIT